MYTVYTRIIARAFISIFSFLARRLFGVRRLFETRRLFVNLLAFTLNRKKYIPVYDTHIIVASLLWTTCSLFIIWPNHAPIYACIIFTDNSNRCPPIIDCDSNGNKRKIKDFKWMLFLDQAIIRGQAIIQI